MRVTIQLSTWNQFDLTVQHLSSSTATSSSIQLIQSKVQSELKDQIATDDVFGPITSPVVEIRLRWVLRSSSRVFFPDRWMDTSPERLGEKTYLPFGKGSGIALGYSKYPS